MNCDTEIDAIIENYKKDKSLNFELDSFQKQVINFFLKWPDFIVNDQSVIHSVKARIKDPEHLRDKIKRKCDEGRTITLDNFKNEITDLIGVRVLYLYHEQFSVIHNAIMHQINDRKEWDLVERPKAYTWDPELNNEYEKLGIDPKLKETYYTSVHYVIKPYNDITNSVRCEIQVRTLFEEIWGEIDHVINYPHPTKSVACSEQLKVLARLVSAGTRLSDSIFRSYQEYNDKK